ncbi:Scr1 family TA system antitoxin-like transcriptional regulator [Nocardiopsis flavescens]
MKPPGFRHALRQSLEISGLTQAALASRAAISQSSLSRYLSGETHPGRKAVDAMDAALGLQGSLLAQWKDHVREDLPAFLRSGHALEGAAARIDLVSPVTVPGLLWCPSYAELVYRAGHKVEDTASLARIRSERLGEISAAVSAVFPVTALTWVPEAVRVQQVEHLLSLPERVSIHLLPEGTLLLGIPGPFSVFQLPDGREVTLSDKLEDDEVYGDAMLPRVRRLLRDSYALALPHMTSVEKLRGLSS